MDKSQLKVLKRTALGFLICMNCLLLNHINSIHIQPVPIKYEQLSMPADTIKHSDVKLVGL